MAADRVPRWVLRAAASAAVVFVTIFWTEQASAHVKWFCAYDVAGSPRGLENVLSSDFEFLIGIAIFVLTAGCLLEGSPLGAPLVRALDRVTSGLRANIDVLFRAVCAFFFVALWTMGGILLTPELKTTAEWVPWMQLAMAFCLIWRRTAPLTAIGIVILYAIAIHDYGIFHLADYPIFLGIAAYLTLTAFERDLFGMRPVDVVRWAAAITLMWASIEKWAYPEWSYPLFIQHPALSLGFSDEFYMRAAGVVEFTTSFALIWTPLVRRAAAIMLAGMFISACFAFGKIDAIGHSAIIVVLLAIVADNAKVEFKKQHLLLAPAGYATALAAVLAIYYAAHAALYGTAIL